MDFDIYITEGGQWYRVHIKKLEGNAIFEKFEISTAINTVTVQSNRPLIRAKGLRWKYPSYTIIEGEIRYKKTFDKITHEITIAMEVGAPEPPKPKPGPTLEFKLQTLGYQNPKRAKSESDEEWRERCIVRKQNFIKLNKDLLDRMF